MEPLRTARPAPPALARPLYLILTGTRAHAPELFGVRRRLALPPRRQGQSMYSASNRRSQVGQVSDEFQQVFRRSFPPSPSPP